MTNAQDIIRNGDHDELVAAVREWANCETVEIDSDGNIWIEGPQKGHWLSADSLEEFVAWTKSQS